VESNRRDGIVVVQPRSFAERRTLALECRERLGLDASLLLDGMDNRADRAFGAWPERLYVLAPAGTVLYQGGKGPYGFSPAELDGFLRERDARGR